MKIKVVNNTTGQLGEIDQSEAGLIGREFREATPEEIQAYEKKAEFEGRGLEAGALGALRGLTFGLSDVALTQPIMIDYGEGTPGILPKETVAGLKEYNPAASTVGEIAGIGGSLIAAPGAGLVGGVSKAGQAVSKAVAPAAEAIGKASPFLSKAIQKGIEVGAGSALEGAAYGAGQSISEAALGDPDLNAEKVFQNVGLGALFGGAIGGVLGAGATVADDTYQAVKNFVTPAQKEAIIAGDLVESARASGFKDQVTLDNVIKTFRKTDVDAPITEESAKLLGVPAFPEQLTNDVTVKKAADFLHSGQPTFSSMGFRDLRNEAYKKVNRVVDNAAGIFPDSISELEVGNTLKQSFADTFERQAAPIKDIYNAVNPLNKAIPVTGNKTRIANNIRSLGGGKANQMFPGAKLANSVADQIEHLNTLDDLRMFRSGLNRSLGVGASQEEKYIVGQISDKLKRLEDASILRFARDEMKTAADKKGIASLIDIYKEGGKRYKALAEKATEFMQGISGSKRFKGPEALQDFIDSVNPQTLAKKVFAKGNMEYVQFLQKNFPEQFDIIKKYQIQKLKEAASKEGFNSKKFLSEVDGLSKEAKQVLFTPEQIKIFDAANQYLSKFPKSFSPFVTEHTRAFAEMFEGPGKAFISNVRDVGLQKYIEGSMQSGLIESATGARVLGNIERTVSKTVSTIKTGSKAIFDFTKDVSGFAAPAVMKEFKEDVEDHKELVEKVNSYSQNPEVLLKDLDTSLSSVYGAAPMTVESLQFTAVRAVSFLSTKVPRGGSILPLSSKYVPSKTELIKFNRYLNTIKKPTSVLKSVKFGTLMPEEIETLQTVYPKLYDSMKLSVMENMTEYVAKNGTNIPYSLKMSLSMFLGQDLDNGLEQKNIAANQLALAKLKQEQSQADNQLGPKPTQAGLSKLTLSTQAMTPMQKSNMRLS